MISNNQQVVSGLLMEMISQNIHGHSNRNQVRMTFATAASQNNWMSPIMEELVKLGMLVYSHVVNGAFGALPHGATDAMIIHGIVNTDFQIVDLYYATWCLSHQVQLGPQEMQQAQQAAQQFNQLATQVGFFQQASIQPQQTQYGAQLASQAFKPGQGAYGAGNSGYSMGTTSTATTTTPTGISSKITIVGGSDDAPAETPVATQASTTLVEPPSDEFIREPTTGAPDLQTWLTGHAERLDDLRLYGPDFSSDRPYDLMLFPDPSGEFCEIWVAAHLSPFDMPPDPVHNSRLPKAYSPAHAVRFLVFTSDDRSPTREDYMFMSDNPDMRYLALEQGASPRDIHRIGVVELGKPLRRLDVPPVDLSETTDPDTPPQPTTYPLVEAIKELSMTISKELPAILVSSREEGELHASIRAINNAGASMYVECMPYFVKLGPESEYLGAIQDAGSLNELSSVFARYSPTGKVPVELVRIHDIINRRLTTFFRPIFEFEFGLVFDSFADDIQALLNAVLLDFNNETLVNFTSRARDLVPVALGIADETRTKQYIHSAIGIDPEEIPEGTVPLVLADFRVVITVPAYSTDLGFYVSPTPVRLDSGSHGLTEFARGVITGIQDSYKAIMGDYGDVQVYVRTQDDVRLGLLPSLLSPGVLTARLI